MRSLPSFAPRPAHPRPLRRRALVLVIAVLALLVPAAASGASSAGGPAPRVLKDPRAGSGITLSVSPASLADVKQGDVVHLHFAGLGAKEFVSTVGTCPAGLPIKKMDLTSSLGGLLACPSQLPTGLTGDTDPTSLNNPGLSNSTHNAYPTMQGVVDVDFIVGSGTAVGTLGYQVLLKNGDRQSFPPLSCDTTKPCTIGFVVQRADGVTTWSDLTSLTIAPGPIGGPDARGCTGLSATVTVTATGAERLQNPLAALDRAFCAATPSPIPVSYIPTGLGENDPSGIPTVGTTSDLAFIGSPALSKSPLAAGQVRVPVALNGVSIAQLGGLTAPSLTPGRIASTTTNPGAIALSTSDVARIVLHDFPTSIPELPLTPRQGAAYNPLGAAVLTRPGNAKALAGLDPSLIGFPFVMAPTTTYSVGEDSTAIALSALLTAAAPSAWSFPDNVVNRSLGRAAKAVGPVTDFGALVDRTVASGTILTSQTSSVGGLYSAKISKDITSGNFANMCPFVVGSTSLPSYQKALTTGCFRFAVMDTATAATISVTSARIASGPGYAAPTVGAMQAAAAGDLTAAGFYSTTAATAYPLTFVEYAVVPTAPLLDDSCRPRTQQATLKAFLSYAVGDGQSKLSTGLAPLTPALMAEAKAAIAQIGTGKPTGACAPKPAPTPTPKPTPAPAPAPGAVGGAGGAGDVAPSSGSPGSPGSSGSTGSTSTGTGAARADTPAERAAEATALTERSTPIAARPVSTDLAVASFQGAARTSTTSSLLGMLAIVLLLTIGAAAAAGLIPVRQLAAAWGRRGR